MIISPLDMRAAQAYVIAVFLSGMTECIAHHNFSTQSISIVLKFLLLILAHIELSNIIMSSISGSSAAFSNTVLPFAVAAAMSSISVPL